jgi:hypothetical protein
MIFLIKENDFEIVVVKSFKDNRGDIIGQIIYRDTETQITINRPRFDLDLSNVQIKDQDHIIFDQYVGTDSLQNEIKSDRSNMDNLVEMGKVMEFDTTLLYLNLKHYLDEYCLLQYFENNRMIGSHTHNYQFVDIPLEDI